VLRHPHRFSYQSWYTREFSQHRSAGKILLVTMAKDMSHVSVAVPRAKSQITLPEYLSHTGDLSVKSQG